MGFRKLCCTIECFHGECRAIFNDKTISKTNSFVGLYHKVDRIKNGICKAFRVFISCEHHYYHKYWQPQAHQKFEWVLEKDNPYDLFARKTTDITSGMTVGHLPMETFRVTKFLFD